MCADGCAGCTAECAACAASGCAGCAGCGASAADTLATALSTAAHDARLKFDPHQLRDADGKWTDTPGGGGHGSGLHWDLGGKPNGPVTRSGSGTPAVADKKAFESLADQAAVAKAMPDRTAAGQLDMAIQTYGGPGHVHINTSLRRGSGLYPGEKKFVAALDSAIDESKLPQDTVLWRGANGDTMFPAEWRDGSLVGAEWTDPSLTSTSANEDVGLLFAKNSASANPVTMRVIAPAGTGALRIGKYGGGGIGKEAEVLLGRNNRYRVIADHGIIKGIRRIDVEVIPGDHGPVPE